MAFLEVDLIGKMSGKVDSTFRQQLKKEAHLWRCSRPSFRLIPQAIRFLSSLSSRSPYYARHLQSNIAHPCLRSIGISRFRHLRQI